MKTPGHAMTAQAGAVAWYCTRELQSGRVIDPPCITANPAYVRAHPGYDWKPLHTDPPAAVPVEALEGLVAELMARVEADKPQCTNDDGSYRSDAHRAAWNFADGLEHAADELTQVIKERSNG